ncbi:MAG: hypothetical protein ABIS18_10860 [Actinomycetota bacterium]
MAIDERSRHGLYLKLEQVLGSDEATTLMEHLPPVGWADVATKHDLEQLRVHLELQIQGATNAIMAAFRGELVALQRHMIFAMTGLMVSMAALAFGVAQFI